MKVTSEKLNYVLIGALFIAAGMIINVYLVEFLFAPDGKIGNPLSRAVFWIFDLIMIMLGITIIIKKDQTLTVVKSVYSYLVISLFNTFILFTIVNIVILFFQKTDVPERRDVKVARTGCELLEQDIDFLRNVYPGYSDQDIRELIPEFVVSSHPTLEFMSKPVRSKHYNIGFESIRYHEYVNDDNASKLINGSTWVFGGSTTFGYGVSDNQTISYYLSNSDSGSAYINFGAPAYHQNLEIEKLILLLKKGFRPKRVIFVDGLNDIIKMFTNNYHPMEIPNHSFAAYSLDYNIRMIDNVVANLKFLIRGIPLIHYFTETKIDPRQKNNTEKVLTINSDYDYENIYTIDALYNTNPELHFKIQKSIFFGVDDIEPYAEKLLHYYKLNNEFISKISEAYDFEYYVFLQPQGRMSEENTFIIDVPKYLKSHQYRNIKGILASIRSHIKQNVLPNFYDISDSDKDCLDCYVDMAHYNPELNRIIAQEILDIINKEI